jgi:hypothetical protein
VIALTLAMAAFAAAPQAAPPADGDSGPGGIHLLEGYQHQREQGEDSSPGRIWKEGGLTIRYDIGMLAGNYAQGRSKAERVWTKQQTVNGRRADIVKSKDGMVYVSFASEKDDKRGDYPANFVATVKNDEEMADLLLIALTYPKRP